MNLSKKKIGLILGPSAFIGIQIFVEAEGLNDASIAVLACTAWIAIWWITEAIPIAATALLPIILFPLSGALPLNDTTASYGHKYVFLFLGGFLLAIAIEKWNLHKRIALSIIKLVGTNLNHIILGFMIATAFLSMWISNTASAVMIMPVALAIVHQYATQFSEVEVSANQGFGKAMMLAIAYSASIGGMATLIGTPPNLVLAGIVEKTYGTEISFYEWFKLGAPVSVFLLLVSWLYLTKVAFSFKNSSFPGGNSEITKQLDALGKWSKEERLVALVFFIAAFAWITKSFLLVHILPSIDDTIIAIICGLILFVIPANKKEKKLINWKDTKRLPWGILILFGGGMALATGFDVTGLAVWIGGQLTSLQGISVFILILILIASVNFLTEITSNLATTAMLLPVLIPLAISMEIHPYLLMVSATLAASCAFMLPVATPPNAVVFGSGFLSISDMVKNGVWLNLISIVILSLIVYFLLPLIWDLSM